ncbi:hypothetical protein MBM09_08985 [Flaviramulus sp. BrNp1-15]|uniref:DUF7793 family protein n=1 Tax=Flaviramulus sp. BrNp1-15 TaxID=2916754 RepID=UPI001EE7D19A|nr:hypothetical protein [Flaviramulus sp. BrNp1-15]ULC58054.1 hypothetical protein MBM09_08985 [Flaviramulus sp. BrNp1-15]
MENIIKIGHGKFWIDSNSILCAQFNNDNPNYRLDSNKVKQYIEVITKLCNGTAMPFLIDIRDSKGTFSPSAAHLFANSPTLLKLRISEAFVLNTIGIKLLIASYKRLYNPNTPYSVFSDIESAKAYCIETKNKFYGSN